MKKTVRAYTDGACSGNPGPGGWGVLLKEYDPLNKTPTGRTKELSGGLMDTTNNQMELQGTIEALKAMKSEQSIITIYTDSKYVMKGITTWIHGWIRNGWKTASKQPVKNKEFWQELHKLCALHQVTWEWVKGHSGHPGNEKADELATSAILRREVL